MQTPDKTIDHGTLRRLVDAGAHVGAEVIGAAGSWGVVISYGHASQTLSATRGQPRTWRQFETLASYLKDLGITEVRVNTAEFEPASAAVMRDKRSTTASDRMKRAHQAAAYDTWFRQQVQASIDDQRPGIDDDQARKQFAAKRAALAKRAAPKKAAAR